MRIARVLHESSALPLLALERDGALYDAGELDRVFATPFSPDRLAGASDFHTRAVALRGAGLDALDDRLLAGDRPTGARLQPGTFLWLPPCDTDRALYVQMAPYEAEVDEPTHRLGNARGILGHQASIPFAPGAGLPDFELGIAAVLSDDLRDADPAQAERAILGYAILNGWHGRGGRPREIPAQLGPVLVTPGELGDLAGLRAQVRIEGRPAVSTEVGGWAFSVAASIAWVSRWMELRAGDVIGAGGVRLGRGVASGITPAWGTRIELVVERMGKLEGRPVPR